MTRINFFRNNDDLLVGFECKGHTGAGCEGEDIVCAFISSACYLVANTVTEIMKMDAKASATDGFMRLQIKSSPQQAQDILNGLVLHLTELQKDYPDNIKVTTTEV